MRKIIIPLIASSLLAGCSMPQIAENSKYEAEYGSENGQGTDMNMEQIEFNTAFLMETPGFTDEHAVGGAAEHLQEAGCGFISSVEVIDDSNEVYSLKIIDENGQVLYADMEFEGYIGPIKDDKGRYLYAPVE